MPADSVLSPYFWIAQIAGTYSGGHTDLQLPLSLKNHSEDYGCYSNIYNLIKEVGLWLIVEFQSYSQGYDKV